MICKYKANFYKELNIGQNSQCYIPRLKPSEESNHNNVYNGRNGIDDDVVHKSLATNSIYDLVGLATNAKNDDKGWTVPPVSVLESNTFIVY